MRLAVVTESRDRVGGVEAYLESILPALGARHDVAFWSASDDLTERGAIRLPPGIPAMTLDLSAADRLHRLRSWRPDLLFAHGLNDPALEGQVLAVAPAVVVQHTYHGTCISSSKTMSWPVIAACERPFGTACLAMYFPRRCGGSNPVTMARLYGTQAARLRNLKSAAVVMTLSSHMATEMRRNGVHPDRVHVVPPFVSHSVDVRTAVAAASPCRLLYLGRLEPLKGVDRLIDSLVDVAAGIGPVRLVIAGAGSERAALESRAARICAADPRIEIRFDGWQDEAGRARLFSATDALVVPSLWPEPFGLVGLEAAAAGVPAVGFATGGIPEWLRDGETGSLATAAGAQSRQLAAAIVRCVGSPETLARLGDGAHRAAAGWTLERHLGLLEDLFNRARATTMTIRAS